MWMYDFKICLNLNIRGKSLYDNEEVNKLIVSSIQHFLIMIEINVFFFEKVFEIQIKCDKLIEYIKIIVIK